MDYYRNVRLATEEDKQQFPKGLSPLIGVYEEWMPLKNYNLSLFCITNEKAALFQVPIYANDLHLAGTTLDLNGLKRWAELFIYTTDSKMFEVQIKE